MDGIATALSGIEEIELLQIQQDTNWCAIAFDEHKRDVSGLPVSARDSASAYDFRYFM